MTEVLSIMFAPINIVLTCALIAFAIYWITVAMGLLDLDTGGMDLDADVGGDLDLGGVDGAGADLGDADLGDADFGADGDVDAGHHGGAHAPGALSGLFGFLTFVNADKVPLMVVLSILLLAMWTLTMLATLHLNPSKSWLMAGVLFVPNFVLAILVTKIATMPLAKFFASLQRSEETERDVTGQVCKLLTATSHLRLGQAEVSTSGAPLYLNVRTREGVEMPAGSKAVVVGYDEERNHYVVEPLRVDLTLPEAQEVTRS